MPEPFDYAEKLGNLTLERKRKFYVLFGHNLTVSVRAIWSDENLTEEEKIIGMKAINEIMHRLIFRIEELHKITKLEDDSWAEDAFWQMIVDYCSENPKFLAGNVGWAIKSSYEKCL